MAQVPFIFFTCPVPNQCLWFCNAVFQQVNTLPGITNLVRPSRGEIMYMDIRICIRLLYGTEMDVSVFIIIIFSIQIKIWIWRYSTSCIEQSIWWKNLVVISTTNCKIPDFFGNANLWKEKSELTISFVWMTWAVEFVFNLRLLIACL
jgi:hypothetical protein